MTHQDKFRKLFENDRELGTSFQCFVFNNRPFRLQFFDDKGLTDYSNEYANRIKISYIDKNDNIKSVRRRIPKMSTIDDGKGRELTKRMNIVKDVMKKHVKLNACLELGWDFSQK